MKKTKITALMLSLVMLYSAAVPGTWANGTDEEQIIVLDDEGIIGDTGVVEIVEETTAEDTVIEETIEPEETEPEETEPETEDDVPEMDEEEVYQEEAFEPEMNFQNSDEGSGSNVIGEESDNSLHLKKTVQTNEDGSYTLTLESYTKGEVSNKPSEVVLVLDHSGSMYSSVDGVEWDINQFFAKADKDLGKFPGAYAVIREPYGDSGIAGEYTMALIRYSEEEGWLRSRQIRFTKGFYSKLIGGPVFPSERISDYTPYDPDDDWFEFGPESGSANYDGTDGDKFFMTIAGATYGALNAFAEEVEGVDNCKVAVVGFSSPPSEGEREEHLQEEAAKKVNNWWGYKHGGTGVYINGTLTHWEDCTDATFQNAFMDMTDAEDFAELQQSIQNFLPDYHGTTTNAGFHLANKIFDQSTNTDANRTVILFTDGAPTAACNSNGEPLEDDKEHDKSRDNAIKAAKTTKSSTYNVHVYAFGPSYSEGVNLDFLEALSSNYPNSTAMNNLGNRVPGDYAGLAGNRDDLEAAFREIGQKVAESATQLNSSTVLKDVISPYFQLPQGADTSAIEVYTSDYDGTSFSDTLDPLVGATVTIVDKSISVTGYDYSKQWISSVQKTDTNDYGSKLVVQIPIVPNPDFLGGDGVLTNTIDSGVYHNGIMVKEFDSPTVNIPVKSITPDFKDTAIYASQAAVIPHIANIGKFKAGETTYRLDGINNEYVDITYSITVDDTEYSCTIPAGTVYDNVDNYTSSDKWVNSNGTSLTDTSVLHPQLTENEQYTVKCSVISVNDNTNSSTKSGTRTIYVYKPIITFQDSVMHLGQTANFEGSDSSNTVTMNYVSIEWGVQGQDSNTGNNIPVPEDDPPILEYTFSPEQGAFKEETKVKITAVISPQNMDDTHNVPVEMDLLVNGCVTFYRKACEHCGHTYGIVNCYDDSGNLLGDYVNFIVHLDTFTLTIVKDVIDTLEDENQSFLFNISDDKNYSMDVVIVGEGNVTINGLPAGVYTVTELTDWSWRYTCDVAIQTADSKNADEDGIVTVTFNNKFDEDKWLSGDSYVENWFHADGIKKRNKSNIVQ